MDEEASFIGAPVRRPVWHKTSSRFTSILPWALVGLLSTYILLTFDSSTIRFSARHGTREPTTDFVSARQIVQQRQQVQFTSSLEFKDPETIYRVYDPSQPVYVGNASEEIDRAWEDLISPADIYVSDEEAATVSTDIEMYRNPATGKLKIELEAFHSLHCLNMIRMMLYKDKYPQMHTDNARIHVDHCVESLRELIMCDANMTPIPIYWSERGQRSNPNYASTHSCRDFAALKQWTRSRVQAV